MKCKSGFIPTWIGEPANHLNALKLCVQSLMKDGPLYCPAQVWPPAENFVNNQIAHNLWSLPQRRAGRQWPRVGRRASYELGGDVSLGRANLEECGLLTNREATGVSRTGKRRRGFVRVESRESSGFLELQRDVRIGGVRFFLGNFSTEGKGAGCANERVREIVGGFVRNMRERGSSLRKWMGERAVCENGWEREQFVEASYE
ncbi:hypothetical protein KFK09_020449 [Dendrobium nobile]|uniref:Uncharacterized protein n=1 Tax=Dendrobium nobile TaxID=94219 RepID=A0A8T3AL02_DENNO|nr:hypothetical protein KFK09_020449 [Dendrobium nobile]